MTVLEANAQRKLRKEAWRWLGSSAPLITILPEHFNSHLSCRPLSPKRQLETGEEMGWKIITELGKIKENKNLKVGSNIIQISRE